MVAFAGSSHSVFLNQLDLVISMEVYLILIWFLGPSVLLKRYTVAIESQYFVPDDVAESQS